MRSGTVVILAYLPSYVLTLCPVAGIATASFLQVLTELLQPRLAGAGDVRHTLRMMGVTAGYVQHVRDEADYRVSKPADLRDGTRLAKLLDCLKRESL